MTTPAVGQTQHCGIVRLPGCMSPTASFNYATPGQQIVHGRVADKDGGYTDYYAFPFLRSPAGGIQGITFNDDNGNGIQDPGEALGSGKTIYLDLNNNGKLDAGDQSEVTGANGLWAFADLLGGTYHVRRVFPAGYVESTGPIDITLADDQQVSGLAIGSKSAAAPPPPPAGASISGFVFTDADKDGVYDSNETKLVGNTVFLDANNNGQLDAGEAQTTTVSGGAFSFSGLAAGTYHVWTVLPANTTYSAKLIDLTLTAGAKATNLSIGLASTAVPPPPSGTASLTGTAFTDNNKNGKYDTGGGIGKNVTLFLDLDGDNLLDANEVSTVTDSNGKFSFKNLVAGTYHVRRVVPSGYTYSTTKIDLTLANGQAKLGLVIGIKKI